MTEYLFIYLFNILNKNFQNKFMSHTTIKWVLRAKSIKLYTNRRAKNIYIDLRRFNTRGITSPTYIKSFLVSRYLSKNFPNFFKVDTEVGLFKDTSVKPRSTFGNHRPDGRMKM